VNIGDGASLEFCYFDDMLSDADVKPIEYERDSINLDNKDISVLMKGKL